jgi:hypothetical protein
MNDRTAAPAGADAAAQRAQPNISQPSIAQMTDLLRRYPTIAEEERQHLLRFLTTGDPEDVARATYGAGLEPRVMAFRKDHPEQFPGFRSWLPLLILLLVTVLGVLWRILF